MNRVIKTSKINRRSKRQEPRNKFPSEISQKRKRLRGLRESSLQASENSLRNRIDILRSRVDLLEGKDKALMKMYLDNGETFSQMARVAGVNVSNVARRIYKLTRRLLDGQYITILRNRNFFTRQDLKIARDYFLKGMSMRKIAWEHGITVYRVRNTMKKIQELTKL
jgi:hypothetical protein